MDRRRFIAVSGMLFFAGCTTTESEDEPKSKPSDGPSQPSIINPDSDDDGVPDSEDQYPDDPRRKYDSDGDGVADVDDAYPEDPRRTADSDGDGTADVDDEFPRDPNRSQTLVNQSKTNRIEEDEWTYFTLELPSDGMIEYDFLVRSGPNIDVSLLDEEEDQFYENGERYRYYTGMSTTGSSGSKSGRLKAGRYYLIFDNSNIGETRPPANLRNDVVRVESTIKTYV